MADPIRDERLAVLAVLAAAAKEAEEFLAVAGVTDDAVPEALEEADRRLKLFLRVSRTAR